MTDTLDDNNATSARTYGLILAGGKSSRFGEIDKAWIQVNHKPLIEFAINFLKGQVDTIIINANRDLPRYKKLSFPVIDDIRTGFEGPLTGIYSVMDYLINEAGASQDSDLFVIPCDMPGLPPDCLAELRRAASNSETSERGICVAHDGERIQPLVGLFSLQYMADLKTYIDAGQRKVEDWVRAQNPSIADFSAKAKCFQNINTSADVVKFTGDNASQ